MSRRAIAKSFVLIRLHPHPRRGIVQAMGIATAIQSFIAPKRNRFDATETKPNRPSMPKKRPSSFDAAVPSGSLAMNVLHKVLDSFERSGLPAAKRRLHHLRKELAFHLTPRNREKLDRQLFDALVEYYVDEK